ncbi:MAG: hypothetical protein RL186_880 [Pseudomonadota bacterium]
MDNAATQAPIQSQALTPAQAQSLPTWRAAFSERTAELMAHLALLAYERDDDVLARALAEGGFELLALYNEGVAQAFLARSQEFAVLAFRGSDSFADWRANMMWLSTTLNTRLGQVRVHQGFYSAYEQVAARIAKDLDDKIPPDLGIYFTGHSLGAALAQIASATLERDTLAACYTFGSPRVGEAAFDSLVSCPHYRFVNGWDLVTTLPPPLVTPFRHNGDPRLMESPTQPITRRDRYPIIKFFQTIVGVCFLFLGNQRLFDDHRLESYIDTIQRIRRLRGKDRVPGLFKRPWV